jgi:hypothetical protein
MARGKNRYFLNMDISGRGGHRERKNEGVYGRCILYPYMKLEE